MENTIALILLSAISIYGLNAITQKIYWYNTGNHFNVPRERLDRSRWDGSIRVEDRNKKKVFRLLLYPVILCRICMSSVWGTVFYWSWGWVIGGATITSWPMSIIAIAGVVVFLARTERN